MIFPKKEGKHRWNEYTVKYLNLLRRGKRKNGSKIDEVEHGLTQLRAFTRKEQIVEESE
jgi:hypothetical protein